MNTAKSILIFAAGVASVALAACTVATRGNSAGERVRQIEATTSQTTVGTANSGSAAGGTTSSTLSGPNNVGGTIGSGSGSAGGTGMSTGAAGGGVPNPGGGK